MDAKFVPACLFGVLKKNVGKIVKKIHVQVKRALLEGRPRVASFKREHLKTTYL
jgi:hypothetical protein